MIALRPLAADDLPLVRGWFDDIETRHWLGGRDWPAKSLRLSGPGRVSILGSIAGEPIGLIDGELLGDRVAFTIVIAPAQRRRGVGKAMTEAAIASAQFADVEEWFAGVERGNFASQCLLEASGFVRVTDEDADGFSYFARRRGPMTLPWKRPD